MIRFIGEKFKCDRFTIVPLACFLTVITYGTVLPDTISSVISYFVWAIVLLESLFMIKIQITHKAWTFIAAGLFFTFICFVVQLLSGVTYISKGGTIFSLLICLMLFFCGSVLGNKFSMTDVGVICRWFLLGAIVMGTAYLVENASYGFNLTSTIYSNINKNSAAQLISTAICICVLGVGEDNKKKNIIVRVILSLYLLIILFLLRSRSCILCFAVSIFVVMMTKYANPKVKRWIIGISAIAAILILSNENFRNTLINNILLANRDVTNLDSLTSGRISIYKQFWELLKGNELFGQGALYYECFYLSVIIQFGIPLGLYLWGYVFSMLHTVKNMFKNLEYGLLLWVIAISYSLNGLFEGLPPFGPGTKNFFLWLLFGIAITHFNRKENGELESIPYIG